MTKDDLADFQFQQYPEEILIQHLYQNEKHELKLGKYVFFSDSCNDRR